jgi:tetratricopeptide (TPR) repeat protein
MLAPNNPIPKGLLGEIAIGKGLPDLARTHFQAILDIDAQNIIAIHGMARISGLEGKTDEVERWLNEAVAQDAQNWRNHHNLGRFHQQQGTLDVAEKSLKKARSLAPKDSIETRLVLCELYLDQGEATRALLEIERVIKIDATAKAWFLRGRAYFDLESWAEAEDDFRRATLTDPQFHDARGAIGNVKIAQGDLEGAAQAFRTTLRFDPNNEAAQQNLKLVEKELAKRSTPPN